MPVCLVKAVMSSCGWFGLSFEQRGFNYFVSPGENLHIKKQTALILGKHFCCPTNSVSSALLLFSVDVFIC